MINRTIILTQAMTNRINAVLAQSVTDPAYFPGGAVLVGHEELIQDALTFDLTYQVWNLAADDASGQHMIGFQLSNYAGEEIHQSIQPIDSLSDVFTVTAVNGEVSAEIAFSVAV